MISKIKNFKNSIHSNNFRILAAILLVLLLATGAYSGSSQAAKVSPNLLPAKPTKVTYHHPPKSVVHKVRFQPWAEPTRQQIDLIMSHEQEIWGGISLYDRINCESRFDVYATNGQYRGLLQIGSWWESVYPYDTPRQVSLKETRLVKKPVIKLTTFSDQHVEREIVRRKNLKVIIIRKGALPVDADPYHAWAAIRVGQRAISGVGESTGWSC